MKLENYDRVAKALGSLDATTANIRIAELEAVQAEIDAAIDKGAQRMAEISGILSLRNEKAIDAEAAADSMLKGGTILLDAPDVDALRQELTAIKAGTGNLNMRRKEAAIEITEIRSNMQVQIAEICKDLLTELNRQAAAHAQALVDVYGAASAIHAATNSLRALDLVIQTRDAVGACRVPGGLIPEHAIEVPREIQNLLAQLPALGRSFRGILLQTAPRP